MSRLQKKCFIASASMHLLLLLVLLASPAFHQGPKEPNLPVLTFIPTRLTDDPFSGGGDPNVATPPAPIPQPVQPEVKAPVNPPPVEIEKPVRRPDPDPVLETPPAKPEKPKPNPVPVTKAVTDTLESNERKPEKTKITPSFRLAKDSSANSKETERAREQAAKARARELQKRYRDALGQVTRNIEQNLSSGTKVTTPPGPGGEFYANYAQVVEAKYRQAWTPPAELDDESATVSVKIVIARDGRVVSAEIEKRSGVTALDRSVARALDLTFIAPFPEGAKDKERTFKIDFSLKSRS